jgi:hypothetical protein
LRPSVSSEFIAQSLDWLGGRLKVAGGHYFSHRYDHFSVYSPGKGAIYLA